MKSLTRGMMASLALGCLALPALAAEPSGNPILIGVIQGTTGAYGNVGIQSDEGAQLAYDELKTNGILGRPVRIESVNDNADGTLAGQLFKKFVSEGAVAIVGSPDTGPVTAQLAVRYKIPDIGIVDGGGLTVYPNGPDKPPNYWVFQSGGNSFAWGAAMADYALKHCKGFAVLHDTTSYGMGAIAAIKKVYRDAGKTLALDHPITENWTSGATAQLMPEVAAVKKSGADCVDVWLSPSDQAAFAQDVYTTGAKLQILGNGDTNGDETFTNLAGPGANGVIGAFVTAQIHPNELFKAFAAKFRAKFNKEPTQPSALTYQAIMTLAHVIEETKSTDRAVIRDAFEKLTNYPGVFGNITFTPQRHVTITEQELTLVKYDYANKKWVEIPK